MRSPQTIGEAWPRPGMGVCQRTFSPDPIFQVTGAGSSETPLECGPRNWGQFAVESPKAPLAACSHAHKTNSATGPRVDIKDGFTSGCIPKFGVPALAGGAPEPPSTLKIFIVILLAWPCRLKAGFHPNCRARAKPRRAFVPG